MTIKDNDIDESYLAGGQDANSSIPAILHSPLFNVGSILKEKIILTTLGLKLIIK